MSANGGATAQDLSVSPRDLCPLDLSQLAGSPLRSRRVMILVAAVVVVPLSFVLPMPNLAMLLGIAVLNVLSLCRAVRVADAVRVFHAAADEGWLQARCAQGATRRPAVITVANGRVRIGGAESGDWPADSVWLAPPPRFLGTGGVGLHTPDGPTRLTFVSHPDNAATFAAIVNRQAHVALQRALSFNQQLAQRV